MYHRHLSVASCGLALAFALLISMVSFTTLASTSKFSYLPENEINYVQVDDQDYPVLLRPWQGKKKLGLAIIVPGLGLSPDEGGFTAYLRRKLNKAGWATLAITPPQRPGMPNYTTQAVHVANAGEKQLNQQSTQAMPVFSEEQQTLNIQRQQSFFISSMSQLDNLGKQFQGKRLLISSDDSAGIIIELLKDNKLPMPDMLAIINPYNDNPSQNQALAAQLAELTIPVLDIQSRDGTSASLATQQSRFDLSPQNAPFRYHQYKILLDLQHKEGWSGGSKIIEGFALRINKAYPNR
ncbi:DUF3530 domain-containing protein [Shewanella sp. GutCb]|uniref:DUF3530 family protein n=1 Tax=Shewanella sp. GutCb TaxID=2058315 RepID=UPI000C7D3AE3|nr:DUF3530 family protein [Shewanella sp. GutCb]PKG74894.1 DUF3530 domain-containing protein [Shewanella sp. GutCb]